MSSTVPRRILQNVIRSDLNPANPDYTGEPFPGTYASRPRPPLAPLRFSHKSYLWATMTEAFAPVNNASMGYDE